jgi:hypothetical protein
MLAIEYANPADLSDSVTLHFKLRNHAVTKKWIERLLLAQTQYPIDAPDRFYGFGSIEEQTADALHRMQQCIALINSHEQIIDRQLTDVADQDTLNYLHHIFEVYHGLLDQQTHPVWQTASPEVRLALADLNLLVHRCESVNRGAQPRHVVTYYGLPKTETLAVEDYALFEPAIQFGTVYLNYSEIGKTLDDLAVDNDGYIADEAFQPFRHYSADFNVKFYSTGHRQVTEQYAIIKQYYDTHNKFFEQCNLPWGHPYLNSGSIPLADLINTTDIIEQLNTRQYVKSVTLI